MTCVIIYLENWKHLPLNSNIRICFSRKYPRNKAYHFKVISFPLASLVLSIISSIYGCLEPQIQMIFSKSEIIIVFSKHPLFYLSINDRPIDPITEDFSLSVILRSPLNSL